MNNQRFFPPLIKKKKLQNLEFIVKGNEIAFGYNHHSKLTIYSNYSIKLSKNFRPPSFFKTLL